MRRNIRFRAAAAAGIVSRNPLSALGSILALIASPSLPPPPAPPRSPERLPRHLAREDERAHALERVRPGRARPAEGDGLADARERPPRARRRREAPQLDRLRGGHPLDREDGRHVVD